jgi:Phage gp6-like head-tail connector protein
VALALVTLQRAKAHLRITDNDHDDDITQKMTVASEILVRHLKAQADQAWTTETLPGDVQAAVLVLLAHLYENRGDAESFGVSSKSSAAWDAINRLVAMRRDPALG